MPATTAVRKQYLSVRVTREQKHAIRAICRRNGRCTISELVLASVLKRLPTHRPIRRRTPKAKTTAF